MTNSPPPASSAGKPQSLFAKLGKKSFEKSSSSAEESTEGSGNLA